MLYLELFKFLCNFFLNYIFFVSLTKLLLLFHCLLLYFFMKLLLFLLKRFHLRRVYNQLLLVCRLLYFRSELLPLLKRSERFLISFLWRSRVLPPRNPRKRFPVYQFLKLLRRKRYFLPLYSRGHFRVKPIV